MLPWMDKLRGFFLAVNDVLISGGRTLTLNVIGTGVTGEYDSELQRFDLDLSALTGGGSGSGGFSYAYSSSTSTGSDPGAGNFRFNNASIASVTTIAVSDVDSNGGDNENFLLVQDDSTTSLHRGTIVIRNTATPSTYAVFDIVSTTTDSSGWVQFHVALVDSSGTLVNTNACSIQFYRTGDAGAPGADGSPGLAGLAGLAYLFESSTDTTTDPASGGFRLNSATHSLATRLAIANTDANSNIVTNFLLAQDDSTTTTNRGQILMRSRATPSTFRIYNVTGASTAHSASVELIVAYVDGSGSLAAAESCDFSFARTGDAGVDGVDGVDGVGSSGGPSFSDVLTETTTARTYVLADAEAYIRYTNAAATGITVPPNSSVAFDVGTTIVNRQAAAGQLTFVPGGGVTINTPSTLKSRGVGSVTRITKISTDAWDLYGDLFCIIGVELTDANQTLTVAGGDDYAQYVAPTANRTKQLSASGATDGRLVTIRLYTASAFSVTVTNSVGDQLYQFAPGATGIVSLRYATSVNEWLLSAHKDLV